ncbi:MAG TPA: biopolymer transporter ExbD [Polyangia bacterium]|jgi:biopolymer transport protein ExbD|nr:biopolymer transporter ExbD [Polyangia bacterium]
MNAGPANGRPSRRRRLTTKRHPKGQVRADINVTPLVDVVLVLLIIFMVVTPMIGRGISVQLPITTNHDKKNDDNKDIIVSISQAGEVFVNADKVPADHLTAAIEAERRRAPDKGIFLKADHRIDYGQAREAMEAIHRAGVEDVQLGTDEKHEAAAGAAAAGGG